MSNVNKWLNDNQFIIFTPVLILILIGDKVPSHISFFVTCIYIIIIIILVVVSYNEYKTKLKKLKNDN